MGSCYDGPTSAEDCEQANKASPASLIFTAATKSALAVKPHWTHVNFSCVLRFSADTLPHTGQLNPCPIRYAARHQSESFAKPSRLCRMELLATEGELFKGPFRTSPGLRLAVGPSRVMILRKCERMIRCMVHETERTVILGWMAKCKLRIFRRHAIYAPIKAKH